MKKILILIIVLGAFFRFSGLNWDQDQHLHPDERFLTMVAQAISFPPSFSQYLDTATSPANPHNVGYPFYVYGTLPLFLVKAVSQLVNLGTYDGLTLVGRTTSALLDTAVILLVYMISFLVFKQQKVAIISAFIYSLSALSIQLAHFFAVDSYLVFFLALSFFLLVKIISTPKSPPLFLPVFLGLSFGCALASKITAVLFLPIIFLGLIYDLFLTKKITRVLLIGTIFSCVAFSSFRLIQPYLFTDLFHPNPQVIDNWRQLKSFDNPESLFPPATQWLKTTPILFPLENLILWGWGPILAILIIFSTLLSVRYIKTYPFLILLLIWVIGLFLYQGVQFAKPMRYFYPIYPFLAIISGLVIYKLWTRLKSPWLKILFLSLLLCWPLAFVSIYFRPHSRVQASAWIYQNIPPGSTLSCEYWDDCLPLGGQGPYQTIELALYDPDTPAKWADIASKLSRTDYLILSSNRLYGSIMTVLDRYPITYKFYADLFAGKLGFVKIAEFSSRPNLPLPFFRTCLTPPGISYGKVAYPSQACPLIGISLVDDYADESWTVYDHPKVIIFKKTASTFQPTSPY